MSVLSDELTNDPLSRGYAGMTDAQAAADLNTLNRDLDLASITGDQAFNVTDATEYGTLTDVEKQLWLAFCGRSEIDPFGSANVAFVQSLFGGGSTTVGALASLRRTANGQSRAQELGLGVLTEQHIFDVRNP